MSLTIPKDQVKIRQRIGRRGRQGLYRISCIGGLQLIASGDGNSLNIHGAAPSYDVAMYLARQDAPDIELDAMYKSEGFDPVSNDEVVRIYQDVTEQLRKHLKNG